MQTRAGTPVMSATSAALTNLVFISSFHCSTIETFSPIKDQQSCSRLDRYYGIVDNSADK